ncbi:NUDIX domain-containing protein [Phytoactinopolyspora endophytica]|uniref:NUDIX domain-containing protein n=1 Tax=Phytoactinopolyspora endophytica TaxID=1642495 RepID=UPI003B837A23
MSSWFSMMEFERDLTDRYPLLFAPQRWEWAGFDGSFSTSSPAAELVTNVHVVALVRDRIVVCQDDRGVWFLPGGTREPGESIEDCAARELEEEAGARLESPLLWVGAHHGVSDRPAPYRPHQPHPEKAWLWCTADVSLHSAPTSPTDGEQVVDVRAVEAAEAQRLLLTDDRWLPELVSLAMEIRSRQPQRRPSES